MMIQTQITMLPIFQSYYMILPKQCGVGRPVERKMISKVNIFSLLSRPDFIYVRTIALIICLALILRHFGLLPIQ